MSKFYTTTRTDAIKTKHTARGHHWIKASVQSFEGSIRVEMSEIDGEPYVEIYAVEGSATDGGRRILSGPLKALLATVPLQPKFEK